jgi:DNA-binding GntR family transcriptional regulator
VDAAFGRDHEQLTTAIEDGNAVRARSLLMRHYDRVRDAFRIAMNVPSSLR